MKFARPSLFLLVAAVCALAWPLYGDKPAGDKPNIIFIFADDWGYGDLGIHGSTFCKTPHLDRMAKEGTDFQNFTVSNPVCSPSRTAVMTGQFPARHSVHQHFADVQHNRKTGMPDWLDPEVTMLPRLLRDAGYVTAHFGKWHLTNRGINDAPLPPAYGYDEYAAFNVPGKEISTAAACPRTVDFIRRHKDHPFFINVWLHETHTPHFPLPQYLKQFKDLAVQKQVYAAVVAEGDAGVGSILDVLRELGLDEKTLVVFSSDNGPEWTGAKKPKGGGGVVSGGGTFYSVGETGGLKGRKRSLFAGGVRVPFIARWPGVVPAGRTDRTSVITAVDLLPTFLEVAGVDLPAGYQPDGESVVSALKGKPFERSRTIFWEWRGKHDRPFLWPHLGVREGPWKLMFSPSLKKTELYNIESDWGEKKNVAAKHPDVTSRLMKMAREWQRTLPAKPPASCISKTRGKSGK
jgi:N-acetylgalactosamine-6-sulfatase